MVKKHLKSTFWRIFTQKSTFFSTQQNKLAKKGSFCEYSEKYFAQKSTKKVQKSTITRKVLALKKNSGHKPVI